MSWNPPPNPKPKWPEIRRFTRHLDSCEECKQATGVERPLCPEGIKLRDAIVDRPGESPAPPPPTLSPLRPHDEFMIQSQIGNTLFCPDCAASVRIGTGGLYRCVRHPPTVIHPKGASSVPLVLDSTFCFDFIPKPGKCQEPGELV